MKEYPDEIEKVIKRENKPDSKKAIEKQKEGFRLSEYKQDVNKHPLIKANHLILTDKYLFYYLGGCCFLALFIMFAFLIYYNYFNASFNAHFCKITSPPIATAVERNTTPPPSSVSPPVNNQVILNNGVSAK